MSNGSLRTLSVAAFIVLTAWTVSVHGQGMTVHGVGPVNRGMGGAGTAIPLEAIGAIHWNPGSISGLPCSEVSFGLELLLADVELSSTIGGVTSTTSGEAGVAPIPAVGWTHHVEDTPVTIGLGMFGIAGFRNNLPVDPRNPLLASSPLFADAEFLQLAPTVSYALSDRLSIGIAPTVTMARMMLDPLGPSVVNRLPTPGSGNRLHWGGGAQLGIYYIPGEFWHTGFTIKSPQFFEEFRFFTPSGVTKFDLDYPMILSLGLGYSGFQDWVFAVDVRYHDFKNTDGFKELGWSNVFACAFGAQYRLNDCWHLRAGYSFNQNPIQNGNVLTNIATPLIQDHNISAGTSYRFASNVDISMAYVYLVNNEVSGPLPSALFGPSASLSNKINGHSTVLGVTVRY